MLKKNIEICLFILNFKKCFSLKVSDEKNNIDLFANFRNKYF